MRIANYFIFTCDLVRVMWAEDDRVGVELMRVALECVQRLHTFIDDPIALALED
jgi:hypothetical protein